MSFRKLVLPVAVAVALFGNARFSSMASAADGAATALPPAMRHIEQSGLVANYFPAPGDKAAPAILLLGGSEGGLGEAVAAMAESLQADGYAVLQASYFGSAGQPKALSLVPLETFDHALQWLRQQRGVDRTLMAVVGASKGAEAALLVASRHPELRAAVAGMPSSVAWAGVDLSGASEAAAGSSWSTGGKPLPFLPYGDFDYQKGVYSLYANGLKQQSQHTHARIPLERFKGGLLLICGESDTLWPSCEMARQIAKARPATTVLAYTDAGHLVFGLPIAESSPSHAKLSAMGGTVEGNASARVDSWAKMRAFLAVRLRPGSSSR